jgi:hypothetical protein
LGRLRHPDHILEVEQQECEDMPMFPRRRVTRTQ